MMSHLRLAIHKQLEKEKRTVKKPEAVIERPSLLSMPYEAAIDEIKSSFDSGSPRDSFDIRNFISHMIESPFLKHGNSRSQQLSRSSR